MAAETDHSPPPLPLAASVLDAPRARRAPHSAQLVRAPEPSVLVLAPHSRAAESKGNAIYLVPVLVASDEPDPATAEGLVARELHDRALYVGPARRLSLVAAATAEFDVRVYANRIELPPVVP